MHACVLGGGRNECLCTFKAINGRLFYWPIKASAPPEANRGCLAARLACSSSCMQLLLFLYCWLCLAPAQLPAAAAGPRFSCTPALPHPTCVFDTHTPGLALLQHHGLPWSNTWFAMVKFMVCHGQIHGLPCSNTWFASGQIHGLPFFPHPTCAFDSHPWSCPVRLAGDHLT